MALRHTVNYNQYRGHVQTVAPASEPITKAQVKAHLRLDTSDTSEDDALDLLIQSAREMAEEQTGLALIDQTWELTLDHWPTYGEAWWDGVRQTAISELSRSGRAADVLLPRYPLQSISSMTADGTAVTTSTYFHVDTKQKPGRLVLKTGATFPVVTQTALGVVITYVAGYGSSASDVPAAIRQALLNMIAYMYENRGDCGCSPAMAYSASGAEAMLNTCRAVQL